MIKDPKIVLFLVLIGFICFSTIRYFYIQKNSVHSSQVIFFIDDKTKGKFYFRLSIVNELKKELIREYLSENCLVSTTCKNYLTKYSSLKEKNQKYYRISQLKSFKYLTHNNINSIISLKIFLFDKNCILEREECEVLESQVGFDSNADKAEGRNISLTIGFSIVVNNLNDLQLRSIKKLFAN